MKQVNTTTRVGTTAEWASGPTLDPGEQGYDTDKKILKVGDGTTAFASLARVTAASKIFASVHTPGGTPGWLQISARVAGTSFTILSSSNTDTSVVDYLIIEP
jgi:hypothetical protein